MGEVQGTLLEPDFNRSVKVHSSPQRITSHAGAVLLREVDHRLGLVESLGSQITDPRRADRIRYTATELLRERIYALALGDENQDDLDRLAHDPAMRMSVWDRAGKEVLAERLASQPTQSRLVDWLANFPENRAALRSSLFDWVHRHLRSTSDHAVMRATIDVDSFPVAVHGGQQGSSYNGYYRDTVYHPLVASFSVEGDYDSGRAGCRLGNGFLDALLREGQVHTAADANTFIERVIKQARQLAQSFDLRLDAGFTSGEVLDALADQNVRFCGRLRKNAVLDALADPYLKRPPGRPPREGYQFIVELGMYRAEGWKHAQRLVLVVIDEPDPRTGQLNLLPRYFFLVTNWSITQRSGEEVLVHYRRRGTFEDRLGEFQAVIGPHLSSPTFAENEVNLLLALLAYNLASLLRIELEDELGGCWDLHRFQQTVLRAGGRVVKHSRRLLLYVEQCVEHFWQLIVRRIGRLRLPSRWPQPRRPRHRTWIPPPAHAHLAVVLRT